MTSSCSLCYWTEHKHLLIMERYRSKAVEDAFTTVLYASWITRPWNARVDVR